MGLFWRLFLPFAVTAVLVLTVFYFSLSTTQTPVAPINVLILGLGLLLLCGGCLWWMVTRNVTGPLAQLSKDMARLRGEQGQQIDLTAAIEAQGNDEVSQLIRNYNQAVQSLDGLLIKIKTSTIRLKPMSVELAETTMGLSQRNQLQLIQNTEVGRELDSLNDAASHMQSQANDIVNATTAGNEAI